MLTAYIVCTALGAALVVLSLLGGHHHTDADAGHEVSHGADSDHGREAASHGGDFSAKEFLSPLISIRFWTYSLLAFGVSGLLLEAIVKSPSLSLGLAIGTGLVAGILAVGVYGAMRNSASNSASDLRDLTGREVEVLVPIRPGGMGRVRCTAKGETLDFIAITEGSVTIEPGTSAVIVGTDGDRVVVLSLAVALEEKGPQTLQSNS
ncbi:MAG: NfeD family protein [Fimbriimonas sp.]